MLGISGASHAAHHRYPVWWTGDDKSLSTSINTMVEFGVRHLKPYVHSDCGGVASKTTGLVDVPEYVRWSQHCALGAIHRYHGGPGHQPWVYGEAVETIIRDFLNMRMQLMPTILAAGARATADGMPLVRRLDLAFPQPQHRENATRTDQYLLADDTLIAPFSGGWAANGTATRPVWIPPGQWQDAWSGAVLAGPALVASSQPLARVPMWHRRGGMVVTAPVAQTVEAQDWSRLTLEVFPFPAGGGAENRTLVRRVVARESELGGGGAAITMTQTVAGVVLLGVEEEPGAVRRGWLLRLHLLPGETASLVMPERKEVATACNTATLHPRHLAGFVPFAGAGAAPPPLAGAVLEVRCPPGSQKIAEVQVKVDEVAQQLAKT